MVKEVLRTIKNYYLMWNLFKKSVLIILRGARNKQT